MQCSTSIRCGQPGVEGTIVTCELQPSGAARPNHAGAIHSERLQCYIRLKFVDARPWLVGRAQLRSQVVRAASRTVSASHRL